jgi:hypothetical protein
MAGPAPYRHGLRANDSLFCITRELRDITEGLDVVLRDAGVAMEPMPRPALFLEQGVPALPGFGRQENRRTAGFLHRRAQCGGTPGFAHSRRMPGPITLANRRRHRHFAAGISGLAGPGACGINDPDDPLTPGQQPVVKNCACDHCQAWLRSLIGAASAVIPPSCQRGVPDVQRRPERLEEQG